MTFLNSKQTARSVARRGLPKMLSVKRPSREASTRKVVSFNQGWRFRRCEEDERDDSPEMSDQKWEAVTLPHSVRLEPLNASGGRNFQGICWYRKKFRAPEQW